MKTRRALFVLSLALLAGCASVTFKRGASPDAMAADEQVCRKAGADDAAYVECMRNRGWFVTGRGAAPDSTAPATPAAAEPHAPADAPEAGVTPAAGAASGAAAKPTSANAPRAAVKPASGDAPAAPVTAAPTAATAAAAIEASDPPARSWWKFGRDTSATAPAEPLDPLARVNVGSWWKLGGSASDLDHAIDTCVRALGPTHRPDPGATVVTAGLQACLRTHRWYALKIKASAAR